MGVIEYTVRSWNRERNLNRIRWSSRDTYESSEEQNDLCWRGGIERNTRWNGASYETDRLAFSRPVFLRPRDTIP